MKHSNMKNISMRDAFFDELYKIGKKDKNVILITADMGAPSLDKFRRDLGKQYINVGIAEANMVTVATGLSLVGKKVFIYAIAPFVTSRCYEFLKVDLSLMNIPITAVGVGAGFSYEESGPTHHCTEDITIMRALPNMTILSASDSLMAGEFAHLSYKSQSPCYVRLDRELLSPIYKSNENFSSGISRLKEGKSLNIISTGNMVHRAFEVAKELHKSGIEAGVIDLYRIKPINKSLLLKELFKAKCIVSIEEHLLMGGLGSAISELLLDEGLNIPFKRFGIPDKYYYAYGGRKNIQVLCGLDTDTIVKGILKWKKIK